MTKRYTAQTILSLMLAISAPSVALATDAVINWTFDSSATATCANGQPAATHCPLTAFQVQELVDGNWVAKSPSIGPALRTVTYSNVVPGRRCYRVLAVSGDKLSDPSTEGCTTVPYANPRAPTITVTVTVTMPE